MSLKCNMVFFCGFPFLNYRCFSWNFLHWKANFTTSEKTSVCPSSCAGMRVGTRLFFLCLGRINDTLPKKLIHSWRYIGLINSE